MRSITFALLVIAAAPLAAPLAAQQPTPPDSARADSARRLPSVVVTALRAPAALATLPFAVAVRDRADVQRGQPGIALDEALRGTGVQVDNRFNYAQGERISIRGFGARAQFGVRGVKVIVDGVPATMPDGQTTLTHVDLGALQRAEVLRGPASSLWGNASGGVILLESAPPPDAPFSQEFGVTTGANGLRRLRSATGGRSGDFGWTVDAARLEYGGFRPWSDTRNNYGNARASWTHGADALRLAIAAVQYDAKNAGSLSDSMLKADRNQTFARNITQQTGEAGRHAQVGAVWQHTLGIGQFELSGYTLGRHLDNPIPNTIIDLSRNAGGGRLLYRLARRDLRLTAGVEGDRQRDDRLNYVNDRGIRGDLTLDQLERVTTTGAFAQGSAPLLPRVALLAGVRWDRARFSAEDHLVTQTNPDDSGDRTMRAVSPAAGLSVTLGDAATLYANVATAFETPTTTELANRPSGAGGFNPDLQPQRTRSYEVGARGTPLPLLRYELAVYTAAVRDVLIPFEVSGAPGRTFFRNAGRATHRGAEASATVEPLRWMRVEASYVVTDAKFERYTVGSNSYDGNRLPGVEPQRADASLTLSRRGGWFATGETRWVARTMVNDANSASSPAYTVTDFRLGREAIMLGRTFGSAFVGVMNAFDTEYNASVTINAFGGRFYEPGPGRALYAGLSLGVLGR